MKPIFNFDEVIDRKNTQAIKYDFNRRPDKKADLLPLWIADMDFKSPTQITEALKKRMDHSIYGYTKVSEDYYNALKNWMKSSFSWPINSDWVIPVPGIVYALSTAIRALTNPGDFVMIQPPVYYPFNLVVENNGRKLLSNPLIHNPETGKYEIDFNDFEEKIIRYHVKAFILCNPHNPVGRVWTLDELKKLGNICLDHGVTVISDEIHEDFIYPGYRHHVFANLSKALSDITVTCTAPSKTFNLAGLETANVIIENKDLHRKFTKEKNEQFIDVPNLMGLVACEAAYTHGRPWLEALILYLQENLNYLDRFLKNHCPEITLIEPEGTYLAWLDLRALNLNPTDQEDLIVNKSKLWLDPGTMFGAEGQGYERLNIACPISVLEEACYRLKKGISLL